MKIRTEMIYHRLPTALFKKIKTRYIHNISLDIVQNI